MWPHNKLELTIDSLHHIAMHPILILTEGEWSTLKADRRIRCTSRTQPVQLSQRQAETRNALRIDVYVSLLEDPQRHSQDTSGEEHMLPVRNRVAMRPLPFDHG